MTGSLGLLMLESTSFNAERTTSVKCQFSAFLEVWFLHAIYGIHFEMCNFQNVFG